MKTKLSLIAGGLFLLSQATAFAVGTPLSLTLTATIPAASGLSLGVSSVVNSAAGTPTFTSLGTSVTSLPFTLTFDTTVPPGGTSPIDIWDASTYYAVDIGLVGGAGGTPVVAVTYADTAKPSGATAGLGSKAVATFDVVNPTATTGGDVVSSLGSVALANLTGVNGQLPAASIPAGDFERVYVGIYTGKPVVTGAAVFTNADAPGLYSGTLTFTATTL